ILVEPGTRSRARLPGGIYGFGNLVGAAEGAKLLETLLQPHVHFARGLRAGGDQLLVDPRFEGPTVLAIGNPRRDAGRDKRREHGEEKNLVADAVQLEDFEIPAHPARATTRLQPCLRKWLRQY